MNKSGASAASRTLPKAAMLRVAGFALTAALLSACGTISRPTFDPNRLALTVGIPPDDVRITGDAPAKLEALSMRLNAGRASRAGAGSLLALSGGGANGAYGAGVIVGWTATGHRPQFDVVTGISTGALAAPFAFLGPTWDGQLERAYLNGKTRRMVTWRNLGAFVAPSLFSPSLLKTLIDDSVTPQLLRQIALEHARGRQLLVVTTNLDSQEPVIWDMGSLAAHGDATALALFRKILLASASIPGVFPPEMIGGRAVDGSPIMEMHVDGGVTTPFLAIPESLLLWTDPDGKQQGRSLFVLVNAQITPEYSVTRGNLSAILGRSYDSMTKASVRTSLAANAAFAERNGLQLSIAAIPAGVDASSLNFDEQAMAALFHLGRQRAVSGAAWSLVRPGQNPGALEPPAAPPALVVVP